MAAAQQWLVRTWDTVLAAYAAEVARSRLGAAREYGPFDT
jgi:recombinational DNA repair ATPase RecF